MKHTPNLDSTLFDMKHEPITTMKKVLVDAIQSNHEGAKQAQKNIDVYESKLKHEFAAPTYYSTNSHFLPFIRIQSVSFSIEVTRNEPYLIPFIKTGITQYILRNIIDGKEAKVGITKAN